MAKKSAVFVGVSPLTLAVANCFSKKGNNIAIVNWEANDERVKEMVASCQKQGANETISFSDNLESQDAWRNIFESIVKQFSRIDYLLYFDGTGHSTPLKDSNLTAAATLMKVNFVAPLLAIHAALPYLKKSKGQVAIVAAQTGKNSALYTASKNALEGFAKAFTAKSNINVNCIYPGTKEFAFLANDNSLSFEQQNIEPKVGESICSSIANKEKECALGSTRETKKGSHFSNGVLRHHPPFNVNDPSIKPLCHAVLTNNKNEIREILKNIKRNPDVIIEKDALGRNSLHYAAYVGNVEVIGQLVTKLRKRSQINSKDSLNWTPLHIAARNGHLRTIGKLLRENGDPNALTSNGYCPFHFLASFNPPHDIKIQNKLHTILKMLVDLGADVNQRNSIWETPIHIAAQSGSVPILQFLLKNEGDVHRKTKNGETPLTFAMRPNNHEVIELLLKSGADPVDCFDIAPSSMLDIMENYREKNRRPEDDDEHEREVVIVNSISDFPPAAKKILDQSNLLENRELIEENWKVFLYVMRFLTRKVYRTPSQAEVETGKKPVQSRTLHGLTLEQAMEKFITNGNPRKLFKTIDDVGRGGFGSVYMARRLDDKRRVAIKRVPHLTDREQWNNFDEIYFLQTCAHSCIVKYYNSYVSRDELWIVMEYMEGGSLQQAVSRYKLEEAQIAYVTKELLRGIRAIHRKKMIHRDLKSANVMLSITGDVKIIDFGLCVEIGSVELTNMVGSPFWIPPEMIRRKEHGQPADIWSLAILCLEMTAGRPPHRNSALRSMFTLGAGILPQLEEEKKWSDEFKKFLSRMLVIDPEKRATAEELLQDPWLATADTKKGMCDILRHIFIGQSLETSLGIVM